MLFIGKNPVYFCEGTLGLMVCLLACASYAYRVNTHRPSDDPKKRNFHFGAIFLAPITWPLFLFASTTIFFLRVLMYMAFLVFFTVALLIIRKPFILIWLDKIATRIGNKLLEANTFLIKFFFGKTDGNPRTP